MGIFQLVRRNILVIVLSSALTGSVTFNIVREVDPRRSAPRGIEVAVGTKVPSLSLTDSTGTREDVRLDDGRWSVVYIMSPSCVWCARNLNNIQALGAARGSKFRFIGVSTTSEGLDQYVRETPMPFPIRLVDSEHLPKGLNMSATPQTIVIGPDGRVKKAWAGALLGKNLEEAEKFFDVRLPGAILPAKKG
jgi:peroxiredoxin